MEIEHTLQRRDFLFLVYFCSIFIIFLFPLFYAFVFCIVENRATFNVSFVCNVRLKRQACKFKLDTADVMCANYTRFGPLNELKLKQIVARVGPVSVAIYASLKTFKFYKNG